MKSLFTSICPWRPTRLALVSLAFSLTGSALIGIAIILVGDFDETEMRVLGTAGALAGFSVLSLPSIFHLEKARYTYLTWTGISASLVFLAMLLFVIWGENAIGGEAFMKTLASVGVVAFATNHICLMLIATPTKFFISICQRATILIIGTVGVLILIAIWTEDMPEMMVRFFGALGVLDALGTITVPILVRMFRTR